MRVSEIYTSVQGEGPRVGFPTVFVRFGGCNLRCPDWACDTQHAIDPKYRSTWYEYDPDGLTEEILKMAGKTRNICFTGGEPMLQPAKDIDTVVTNLARQTNVDVEMFSNGTLKYTKSVLDLVNIVMDWKLQGSGEGDKYSPQRLDNYQELGAADVVKFTIANKEDYDEAVDIWDWVQTYNALPTFYYGVVWGKLKDAELISWVLEDRLPWVHTMQVHNYIWDRNQRGI